VPPRTAAVVLAVLVPAAAGCGTESSERDVRRSVERFNEAFEARDGAAACEQLSEETASALETSAKQPCEDAVLGLELAPSGVGDASVWMTSAEVKLEGGGTVFLDEIGGSWRITAIGCEPRPGQPYDCELEG